MGISQFVYLQVMAFPAVQDESNTPLLIIKVMKPQKKQHLTDRATAATTENGFNRQRDREPFIQQLVFVVAC
ncbi:hypothetical protein RB195_005677 [Necator americanus]|uniref:Uncharacterized protein n=1 Tax=Necator americanus TaxID=51031 RepID=A0ABR1BRZ8_NECAM